MYSLNIPYKSKPGSKLPIFGVAKYIINSEWKVLQEYCELKEGSKFKWKNINKFWKYYGLDFQKSKQKIIDFRKQMMSDDTSDYLLSTNDLKIINKEFFEHLSTF